MKKDSRRFPLKIHARAAVLYWPVFKGSRALARKVQFYGKWAAFDNLRYESFLWPPWLKRILFTLNCESRDVDGNVQSGKQEVSSTILIEMDKGRRQQQLGTTKYSLPGWYNFEVHKKKPRSNEACTEFLRITRILNRASWKSFAILVRAAKFGALL